MNPAALTTKPWPDPDPLGSTCSEALGRYATRNDLPSAVKLCESWLEIPLSHLAWHSDRYPVSERTLKAKRRLNAEMEKRHAEWYATHQAVNGRYEKIETNE